MSDVDRSRQLIIGCRLKKNRWPRRGILHRQIRPSFSQPWNESTPTSKPEKRPSRTLLRVGRSFLRDRRHQNDQLEPPSCFFFARRRTFGREGAPWAQKGAAVPMQIYAECISLSRRQFGALRLLGYRIYGAAQSLEREIGESSIETGSRETFSFGIFIFSFIYLTWPNVKKIIWFSSV